MKSDRNFRIIKEISFEETPFFLIQELKTKPRTPFLYIFFIGFILSCFIGIFLFIIWISKADLPFYSLFISFGISFFTLLLLIPFHELLHGLAFTIKGAEKIQYGVLWKSFSFYTVAVHFACNYKQFRYIALFPFFCISFLLISLLFFVPFFFKMVLFFTFIQHYSACIGDFLLSGFFYRYKNRPVITWDDFDTKTTYFLEKIDSDSL